jgi:hypothetical protein
MATPAQTAANRRNSQSSTGPRTETGRITSSQNSTRTGLYAKSLLIHGEDAKELAALQQDYFDSCDPQGALETALVRELISSDWLLRRMATIETQLWDSHVCSIRKIDGYNKAHHFAYVYYRIEDRLIILQRRAASLLPPKWLRSLNCARTANRRSGYQPRATNPRPPAPGPRPPERVAPLP